MLQNNQLHNTFLEQILKQETHISVYLINGIKLFGILTQVDAECILLQDTKKTMVQLVYKHAISTIVPTKNATALDSDINQT